MVMTKFGSTIITLLFAALVLFAALGAPTMVEAQKSCKLWLSKTMTGDCHNAPECNKHCIQEKANNGKCVIVNPLSNPYTKCACYPCP
ncbi:hypothetical protein AALP_AA2G201400 [Arabis alpina]|uniref:Knottin scorpion toxin-like domain-containing protein n=1 Tax=Arabis alpina TaxID=50452 RepID=A0A087HIR3_ARAAL|nr:hypothetical protein AALP_AA2G201400 [Arabis alpina]